MSDWKRQDKGDLQVLGVISGSKNHHAVAHVVVLLLSLTALLSLLPCLFQPPAIYGSTRLERFKEPARGLDYISSFLS